jgi:hypothetical protein|tara:strand:- start:460 stop:645 length:186 start_codon:yes stop_codon:yes gene_type:complete
MSFDIFLGGSAVFPMFTPLISENIIFSGSDWTLFEFLAIAIIFVVSIIFFRKQKIKMSNKI